MEGFLVVEVTNSRIGRVVVLEAEFAVTGLGITNSHLRSGQRVSREDVRELEMAQIRVRPDPQQCIVSFNVGGVVFGAMPGEFSKRLGFIARPFHISELNPLSTPARRQHFANMLREVLQDFDAPSDDDPTHTLLKRCLYHALVCVDMKLRGNANPLQRVIATILDPQIEERIEVFAFDDYCESRSNEHHTSSAGPIIVPILVDTKIISIADFDTLTFRSEGILEETSDYVEKKKAQ
jgi:hypothetical protein